MTKNNLFPKRRFKKFRSAGDWEQRKLGDITKISTGKLDANAMVENGKYDFYTSGIKKYRIDVPAFEGPAITIAGNGATVGYMHLADNKFNAYQRTYVLQEFVVDRSFLFSEVGNKLPKKINQEARTGNIPYIVMDMLTELKLSIPQDEAEQSKIGSFFKQMDNTIDLHQRKLEKLKSLKVAYLAEMFPAEGEKKPKRRFEGFTKDWELRKLCDLMTFSNGINAPKESYGKGRKMISVMDILDTQSIEYKNIRNSVLVDEKLETRNKVEKGDLIFVRSSEILEEVGWARAYLVDEYALYSGFSIRGKKVNTFNSHFVELTLNFANRKQIERKAGGSTRFNVSQSILNSIEIFMPEIEEQNKIDLLITQLDNTIIYHQHKLEKLQNLKKAYLNEMFV